MYKIADFNMDFKKIYSQEWKSCREYLVSDGEPCAVFSCNSEEVAPKTEEDKQFSLAYLEFVELHKKVAEWLPFHNAFVLHCACFDVNGVGVAFTADSGTGKTTHMHLWKRLLGDNMTIVNGDKPIVRFFDNDQENGYAYGTPWNGKERYGCNMRTKIKHICFIERNETNFVESLDKNSVVDRLFNQVYMPKNPIAVMNTMKLIDRLIACCEFWIIHCNMDEDAAKIAYDAIFKDRN